MCAAGFTIFLVFSLIAAVHDFSVSVSLYRLLEARNQQKNTLSLLGLVTVNHISLCANSGLYSNRLRFFYVLSSLATVISYVI